MNALNGGMMELISLRGRLTITRSNRRMRKTACPVVWEGTGKQPGPLPDRHVMHTSQMPVSPSSVFLLKQSVSNAQHRK